MIDPRWRAYRTIDHILKIAAWIAVILAIFILICSSVWLLIKTGTASDIVTAVVGLSPLDRIVNVHWDDDGLAVEFYEGVA